MECFNTQAADRYANEQGELDRQEQIIDEIKQEIYESVEKHIKADPVLVAFADRHCDDLDDFIKEVAKEQMKIEGITDE